MNTKRTHGFTLVETLVYLALYAIIMTGALVAVYSIDGSSARNTEIAMAAEEGDYLLGKIEWALSDAASIQSPASAGSTLTLTRADGSAVSVWLAGHDVRMQEGDSPAQTLNNTDVAITGLRFVHARAAGIGAEPESIEASFTLSAKTPDGRPLTRDFSATTYLRK